MESRSIYPESGTNGQNLATKTPPLTDGALTELSQELKTYVTDTVAAASKSIGEFGGAIAVRAQKAATATDDYVHEEPWKVIGIAAATSFLLGMFLARRR